MLHELRKVINIPVSCKPKRAVFKETYRIVLRSFFGKEFKFETPTSLVVLGLLLRLLILLRAHTLN